MNPVLDKVFTSALTLLSVGIPVVLAWLKAYLDEKKAERKAKESLAAQEAADAAMKAFIVKTAQEQAAQIAEFKEVVDKLKGALNVANSSTDTALRQLAQAKLELYMLRNGQFHNTEHLAAVEQLQATHDTLISEMAEAVGKLSADGSQDSPTVFEDVSSPRPDPRPALDKNQTPPIKD